MRGRMMCTKLTFLCLLPLLISNTEADGQLHEKYLGCFLENLKQRTGETDFIPDLTIEKCILNCYNKTIPTGNSRPTFAGLTNGRTCLCDDNIGEQVSDVFCNTSCAGSNLQYCGGEAIESFHLYSIYTVCPIGFHGIGCDKECHCLRDLPCNRQTGNCTLGCANGWTGFNCNTSSRSIGCYKDRGENSAPPGDPAMEHKNPGGRTGHDKRKYNSVEFCIDVCSSNGNTYAGMQYEYDCNCGESYDRYGTFGAVCDHKCPANSSQICGGLYANSVYYVCPIGYYGRDCSHRCNCANGTQCRFNGSCPYPNICRLGWTGAACDTKVELFLCKTDGECGSQEVFRHIDLKYAYISRCRCAAGFRRINPWQICTDIDECQENSTLCDARSEVCKNTIGNFECQCKGGFQKNGSICKYMQVNVPAVILGVILAITLFIIAGLSIQKFKKPTRGSDSSPANDAPRDTEPVPSSRRERLDQPGVYEGLDLRQVQRNDVYEEM